MLCKAQCKILPMFLLWQQANFQKCTPVLAFFFKGVYSYHVLCMLKTL